MRRWFAALRLRRHARRTVAERNGALETLKELALDARVQGNTRLPAMTNFILWMTLFQRDFDFLYTDALLEQDEHKSNVRVRQLAVSLSDFFDRVNSVTGTGIRPEIQKSRGSSSRQARTRYVPASPRATPERAPLRTS